MTNTLALLYQCLIFNQADRDLIQRKAFPALSVLAVPMPNSQAPKSVLPQKPTLYGSSNILTFTEVQSLHSTPLGP